MIERLGNGEVTGLAGRPETRKFAQQGGPVMAIRNVLRACTTKHEVMTWAEEARIEAIVGSQRLSLASLKSGVRCYCAFVGLSVAIS